MVVIHGKERVLGPAIPVHSYHQVPNGVLWEDMAELIL